MCRSNVITVTLFILVKSQNPCHFKEIKAHLVVLIESYLGFQHINQTLHVLEIGG